MEKGKINKINTNAQKNNKLSPPKFKKDDSTYSQYSTASSGGQESDSSSNSSGKRLDRIMFQKFDSGYSTEPDRSPRVDYHNKNNRIPSLKTRGSRKIAFRSLESAREARRSLKAGLSYHNILYNDNDKEYLRQNLQTIDADSGKDKNQIDPRLFSDNNLQNSYSRASESKINYKYLTELADTAKVYIQKSIIGTKAADIFIDGVRWLQHPTDSNAYELASDLIAIRSLYTGFDRISLITTFFLTAYKLQEKGLLSAIGQTAVSMAYMSFNNAVLNEFPNAAFMYRAFIAGYGIYHTGSKIYELMVDNYFGNHLHTSGYALESYKTWYSIYEELAQYTGFSVFETVAQYYKTKINLSESLITAYIDMQRVTELKMREEQIKEMWGKQHGSKLFDCISPAIEKKYDLKVQMELGNDDAYVAIPDIDQKFEICKELYILDHQSQDSASITGECDLDDVAEC